MGVTLAEVSPDIGFRFNSYSDCRTFLVATGGFRHRYAVCLYACRMGMGAVEWFYDHDTTYWVIATLRCVAGVNVVADARLLL